MASVNIKIEVDDSEVSQKFQKTTDRVESLGDITRKVAKEIRTALAGLKDVGSVDEAFAKIDQMSSQNLKEIQALTEKINELKNASQKAFDAGDLGASSSYRQQADELDRLLQTRIRLQNEIGKTADALHQEEAATETATQKAVSFRTEMMHALNDYRQMSLEMRRGGIVDPAKYEEAKNKVAEMRRAMAGVNAEMSILASNNPTLTGLIAGAQGVAGAFSVAQGIMGLFNTKNEEMQKIMMRVQSLMAIMMGLQQVQNTLLKKDAILTVTVGNLKKWWAGVLKQVTIAQVAETTATTAAATATTGFAGALRAVGVAIKSIPIIGWILALVSALVALVSSLTSLSETEKMANEAAESFLHDSAEKAAEPIAKIKELERAWNNIKFSPLKTDFLKDAVKAFQELGYAIDDVKQAEDLLSNPDAVRTLQMAEIAKAQAEAARSLIVKYEAQRLEAKMLMDYASTKYNEHDWINRNITAHIAWWTDSYKEHSAMWENREKVDAADTIIPQLVQIAEKSDLSQIELLNTLGLRLIQPSGGGKSGKSGKKLKTAEEIAKEFNAFTDKVIDSIEAHKNERLKQLSDSAIDEMEEGLEKDLKKIIAKESEAKQKLNDWAKKVEDDAIAELKKEYKERYGKEAPDDITDESQKEWQAMYKGWRKSAAYQKYLKEFWVSWNNIEEQSNKEQEKAREKAAKKEAESMLKGLSMQEEYEKKKLAIVEEYEKRIAEAIKNGDKAEAEKIAEEGKNEIDELTTKYNKETAELFLSTTNRSRASLEAQLGKLRERLQTLQETKGSLEDIKDIQEKMDEVQDALDEKDEMRVKSIKEIVMTYAKALGMQEKAKKLEEQAAKLREQGKDAEADQLEERARRLREAAKYLMESVGTWWQVAITAVVEGFQLAAQYAQKIADITGDTKLTDWAEQASALAQNLNAAWQGYQSSGSPYGAIAGGAADILEQSINAKMESKLWIAEFNRAIKNFRNAIELAAVTFDSDKFKDMFGVRSLESATEAYKKMNEAQQKYNEKVTAAFNLGDREKHFNNLGDAIFQGHSFVQSVLGAGPLTGLLKSAFGFGKKTTQKWYSELDAYTRGLNQLQAMQVEVKHANGWARFWGKQSQYKSLYDVAPELWDENGEFNVENAEKFLQVSKQLTDEQRDQIQNAIDLKKAYDDAKQALEDVISETVGSFADDMANAVWDAITTGANAWDVFKEKGNEALVALGKQMLKEFAISTYLEQFKDKLRDAYGSGDMSTLANVYTEIFNGIPMVLENMTIAGENWVRMLKEHGYDVTATSGATSGSTGGYQTAMSHEDASEINGRMTDIQMQMRLMSGNVTQIVALQQESRGFAKMQADYLYDIRRYTSTLPTIAEYSKKIATNTANL